MQDLNDSHQHISRFMQNKHADLKHRCLKPWICTKSKSFLISILVAHVETEIKALQISNTNRRKINPECKYLKTLAFLSRKIYFFYLIHLFYILYSSNKIDFLYRKMICAKFVKRITNLEEMLENVKTSNA